MIPILKELIAQASGDPNNAINTASMAETLEIAESLLSVKMLTVLQLVGFNFKQAIGEPLTLLLQKLILSKAAADTQSNVEFNKLSMAFNVEVAKIAQDQDATERFEHVLARLKG